MKTLIKFGGTIISLAAVAILFVLVANWLVPVIAAIQAALTF